MPRFIPMITLFVALLALAIPAAQAAEEPTQTQPVAGQYRLMIPMIMTPSNPAAPAAAPAAPLATNAEAEAAFAVFATARRQFYDCTAPVVRDTALDSIAQALIAGPVPGLTVRGFGSFNQARPFPMPSQLWQGCESESPELAEGVMLRAGLAQNPATGTWLVVIDR